MFICAKIIFARFFEKNSLAEENLFHFSFGWKFSAPAASCVTFLKRRLKCHDLHFINGKYHQKNPCVKIINLPWKFSIFRTWNFFSDTWKKYIWKCAWNPFPSVKIWKQTMRENRFLAWKKWKKRQKMVSRKGFIFTYKKKALVAVKFINSSNVIV